MCYNIRILVCRSKPWEEKYYLTIRNNDHENGLNITTEIFSTQCRYYDTFTNEWSTKGSYVVADSSTLLNTGCSYNHMTLFGSSVLKYSTDLNFAELAVRILYLINHTI